jgi:hypothetical protein
MSVTSAPVGDRCVLASPISRRFYVHERSFGYLVVAQPSTFADLALALGLSGASRAADQAIEDQVLFGGAASGGVGTKAATEELHALAAEALRQRFQLFVHLVPPRFGATEFLLEEDEQVVAWCYEDGYFTYATGEEAAQVMYSETGSLRDLRTRIRRSPDEDPTLRMVTGDSLFLVDQSFGSGNGTAKDYRTQAARLLRRGRFHPPAAADEVVATIHDRLSTVFAGTTVGGAPSIVDVCTARARLTIDALVRSQPGFVA